MPVISNPFGTLRVDSVRDLSLILFSKENTKSHFPPPPPREDEGEGSSLRLLRAFVVNKIPR